MKGLKIFFWIWAIIMTLGSLLLMADLEFDVYALMALVQSWLVIYYVEN